MRFRQIPRCRSLLLTLLVSLSSAQFLAAQATAFQLDPDHTAITFTISDVIHTVHGSFRLKHGALCLDPATGKLSGEVIVDAQSGQSGSTMRDRKMHREILESERYPEISFRPDRIEGAVAESGKSLVQIHGLFGIHGAEHEIKVPAAVEISPEAWSATVHFSVPYVQWGMKNPSTLFLRVTESAELDFAASGKALNSAQCQ